MTNRQSPHPTWHFGETNFSATAVVLANLMVDVLCVWNDPRIKSAH